MGRQSEEKNKLNLVIILIALLVMIVCLIATVLFVNHSRGEQSTDDISEEALPLDIISEIEDKFYNYEYSMDETIDRYEKEISTGSDEKRVLLAIDYANFIYRNTGDLQRAIKIIENIKPQALKAHYETKYYGALRNLCLDANEAECASNYDNDLKQFISEKGEQDGTIQDE